MIRGIYTAVAGMVAQEKRMDVVSNNLANIDKTAFKQDTTIFKAFPEKLLHRTNDDGVGWVPMGSYDTMPIVGVLGTGTSVNEVYTRFEQGPLKETGNKADLALDGKGFFVVQTDRGEMLSRAGNFTINNDGFLVTPNGFPVLGENGPLQVARGNFRITENGEVWINGALGRRPENFTSENANDWKQPVLLDRIRLRQVEHPRHLNKIGDSFYAITPESGPMREIPVGETPRILSGFIEKSNVNIVREMVKMIEVQRSYEAGQKVVQSHDQTLGKLINEVAR